MKKYHIEYRLFFVKKLEDRIRYEEVILCKFFTMEKKGSNAKRCLLIVLLPFVRGFCILLQKNKGSV